MQTEFEATFYPVDKEDMRRRLKDAGAEMIYPEFLMKRVVFNPPISALWTAFMRKSLA